MNSPEYRPKNPARLALVVAVGGWLFRRRTWIPVPLAFALLLLPPTEPPSAVQLLLGLAIVAVGEGLRLSAVRHIGVISRTRSDRLGPVIRTGPFARVRNPLYLGNIALWVGLAISAHLLWLAPIFIVALGLEYHAIVRWEEDLLKERRGDDYLRYAREVPRWIPSITSRSASGTPAATSLFSWRETLFSERGTLIAIVVAYLLLFVKAATLPS